MFFIPTRDGIESGKVGIRDGIEFRSKISGRDAKNPGIFGTGSITNLFYIYKTIFVDFLEKKNLPCHVQCHIKIFVDKANTIPVDARL